MVRQCKSAQWWSLDLGSFGSSYSVSQRKWKMILEVPLGPPPPPFHHHQLFLKPCRPSAGIFSAACRSCSLELLLSKTSETLTHFHQLLHLLAATRACVHLCVFKQLRASIRCRNECFNGRHAGKQLLPETQRDQRLQMMLTLWVCLLRWAPFLASHILAEGHQEGYRVVTTL